MTTEDNVLYNAQYYIHFLSVNSNATADDDGDIIDDKDDDNDDDCKHFISLNELLTFSRLREACEGDVNVLR